MMELDPLPSKSDRYGVVALLVLIASFCGWGAIDAFLAERSNPVMALFALLLSVLFFAMARLVAFGEARRLTREQRIVGARVIAAFFCGTIILAIFFPAPLSKKMILISSSLAGIGYLLKPKNDVDHVKPERQP